MITISNKTLLFFFAIVLLSAAALSVYFAEPVLLLLPIVVLAGLYFLQNPEYLFYLLLAAIPWSVEYHFSQSFATDLPDEPLMVLVAFTSVILLIYKRRTLVKQRFHPLLLILLIQFLWLIVSVLFSTQFAISLKYLLAKSWYLFAFTVAPVLLMQNKKVLTRAAAILFTSMFIVTIVTVVRHMDFGFTFSSINNALRPFFRNHVNYSALLVCIIPIQIAFLRLSERRAIHLYISISIFIVLVALYFSYSRGAWLALIAGLFSYWLIKNRLLFFGFLSFIFIIMGSLFWLKHDDRYLQYAHNYKTTIFHENFNEHLTATYKLKDVSTAERFYRWIAGVRMVKDNWETGFGPATFYQNYKSYTVPLYKTWVSKNEERSTVHNYFLLIAIEQGAMGLLLWLFLLATLFWYAQKIYHRTHDRFWKVTVAATAAILVMQCVVNFLSDLIETDKVGSIFYLCVAVLIIADNNTSKKVGT